MNSQQVAVLLEAEHDHLITALELVKQCLPDDFLKEREYEECFALPQNHPHDRQDELIYAPVLEPVYEAVHRIWQHIKVLKRDGRNWSHQTLDK